MKNTISRDWQHDSEPKYQELADALPVMILEADLTGVITSANRKALEILGYAQEDIDGGTYIWETVTARDRAKAQQRFKQILKGENLFPTEYTALRKDASTLLVVTDTSPITTEGKLVGVRSVILDITEHRKVEKIAEERERRYRDLFNNASDAIFIRDLEGNIIEVNKRASTLTGYTTDELVRMNVSQLMTADSFSRAIQSQQEVIEGQPGGQRYELDMVRKDGTTRIGESVTSLINDKDTVGVQAIVRDVTAQRRRHQVLQFYISRTVGAQEEARRRVARELHDDTIQSLARLSLDIQAIARHSGRLPNKIIQAQLEKMRQSIENVIEGIRRLTHALRPDVLDQLGLASAIESLVLDLNRERKIAARVEITGLQRRLKDEVEVGLFRITQEALNNVRWHSQATHVLVKLGFTPDSVCLSITDDGTGFNLPETIGNLTTNGKLGLINIQERARLLNGVFSLNSEPGKGTEVVVEIRQ